MCECASTGREGEINEQQIGIVFGRSPGYNSNEDSVVRSQARLLRSRLELYFQHEGREEALEIRIPKGSYIPHFEPRAILVPTTVEAVPEWPVSQPAPPPAARQRLTPLTIAVSLAALASIMAIAAITARWLMPASPSAVFWSQIFTSARPTTVVPDDTTLVLVQLFSHKPVDLRSYLSRSYLDDTGNFHTTVSTHRYTNMTDLNFFARLSRVPEFKPDRTIIRYARDLQMADLRGANLLLMGARRANPWVELFDQKNNFQGLYSEERGDYILNRAPQVNERPVYLHRGSADGASYGLISLAPGITGDESVLMVGGTDTAGTEGAANFSSAAPLPTFWSSPATRPKCAASKSSSASPA